MGQVDRQTIVRPPHLLKVVFRQLLELFGRRPQMIHFGPRYELNRPLE